MTAPRELVAGECARRGQDAFVRACVRLVGADYDDVGLIRALAPRSAPQFFDGREHDDVYWFRVWGMRGLLWSYDDAASAAVVAGLSESTGGCGRWPPRSSPGTASTRHWSLTQLRGDPVPRARRLPSAHW